MLWRRNSKRARLCRGNFFRKKVSPAPFQKTDLGKVFWLFHKKGLQNPKKYDTITPFSEKRTQITFCRRSLVVEFQLPKLTVRVRFPSPAPKRKSRASGFFFLVLFSLLFSFFSLLSFPLATFSREKRREKREKKRKLCSAKQLFLSPLLTNRSVYDILYMLQMEYISKGTVYHE